jgi:hypothetical protein
MKHIAVNRKQSFNKIFRWEMPKEQPEAPSKVEIAGTFTGWKAVPLSREISGGWHLALNEIPGNRTHHYMLLADGKPVHDRNSDGLAVPQSVEEEKFAITTLRGPRVFMLFAQTK